MMMSAQARRKIKKNAKSQKRRNREKEKIAESKKGFVKKGTEFRKH